MEVLDAVTPDIVKWRLTLLDDARASRDKWDDNEKTIQSDNTDGCGSVTICPKDTQPAKCDKDKRTTHTHVFLSLCAVMFRDSICRCHSAFAIAKARFASQALSLLL